jgi:hypothetical protein
MKLINPLLLVALTVCLPVLPTEANDILQILFDDNQADACSEDEWWQIDASIYVLSQQQRALRGNTKAISREEILVDDQNRALWPNYCANRCDGFVPRTCKALNCKGYRRRGMIEEMTRGLFWASNCNSQIADVNSLLNDLRLSSDFSASCQWYLGLYRNYHCFTDDTCEHVVDDGIPEDVGGVEWIPEGTVAPTEPLTNGSIGEGGYTDDTW